MAAFVGSRRFPSVTCHNKKDGRKEACDIALRQLIAEGQFQAEAAKEASVRFYLTQNHTTFFTFCCIFLSEIDLRKYWTSFIHTSQKD